MAIVPFVRQFAHTDQDWFNQQPWTHLQTWLAALIDSEIYTHVMKKYPKWESGTPGIEFQYG
jgi:glutathione S-transferase